MTVRNTLARFAFPQLLGLLPVLAGALAIEACQESAANEDVDKTDIALQVGSGELALAVGEAIALQVGVTVSSGRVYTLQFTSSDPDVVAVSPAGVVTGGKSGAATVSIVATVVDSGASAAASVAVSVGGAAVDPCAKTPASADAGAPAGTVTGIAAAFATGENYAFEAPNDADRNGYAAKPFSNGLDISSLTGLTTVSRNGVPRIGPTTVDGLPVLRHVVYSGDPTRYDGNRAELSYDDVAIYHGNDYWMSFAVKLDTDWTAAGGGGSSDRQSLMQVHQQASEMSTVNGSNPFGVQWRGVAGQEIQVVTVGPDSNPTVRFIVGATPGAWQRYVVHYRSGVTASQNPTLELWVANGAGSYAKLTDKAPGALFGDPAQKNTHDWAKIGIYKWTYGTYGTTSKRGMYSSGLFFAKGTSLFDQAAASVAAFAK